MPIAQTFQKHGHYHPKYPKHSAPGLKQPANPKHGHLNPPPHITYLFPFDDFSN